MVSILFALGLCLAQDGEQTPVSGQVPAGALSDGPPESPVPPPPGAAERPLAIPASGAEPDRLAADEARSRAIRAYGMQHLHIRTWQEVRSSGGYSTVGVGTYGPYGPYGYGGVAVMTPWVWTEERWSVYRGPQRLNNLQYLDTIGAPAERAELASRIRKNRTVSSVFYGVAIAGAGATVTSMIAMDQARPNDLGALITWRNVGLAGLGGIFGGVLAGSLPAGRARRLGGDPTAIRSWEGLQEELLDHNDALRNELGLSPDDALRVESAR